MVFCNIVWIEKRKFIPQVTILILIDGFLQFTEHTTTRNRESRNNPYFNRWFSAMTRRKMSEAHKGVTILILIDGFLQ